MTTKGYLIFFLLLKGNRQPYCYLILLYCLGNNMSMTKSKGYPLPLTIICFSVTSLFVVSGNL